MLKKLKKRAGALFVVGQRMRVRIESAPRPSRRKHTQIIANPSADLMSAQ